MSLVRDQEASPMQPVSGMPSQGLAVYFLWRTHRVEGRGRRVPHLPPMVRTQGQRATKVNVMLPSQIQLQPVASSDVSAVGYDETTQILVVDFIKTGEYSYLQVKPEVFQAFMAAESKGRFVNAVFKQSNWPYVKGRISDTILSAPIE